MSARHGGDHRGSNARRHVRKYWLLAQSQWGGTGCTCHCVHCGKRLTYKTVTADRKIAGGPYARWNIQPACLKCNRERFKKEGGYSKITTRRRWADYTTKEFKRLTDGGKPNGKRK